MLLVRVIGLRPESASKLLLSLHTLPTVILLAISIFILYRFIASFRRLSHVPGPPCATFGRLWLARVVSSGHSADQYVQINNKYGKSWSSRSNLLQKSRWKVLS